ncbi:hypothetical protein C4901_08175 [Acidiferrobacter sp. SPIII_3]|nr:hypothetical protein C4901_00755 [Acidiferrobacter sp. SPIII_3]AWP22412.1 hypothetical protein C4901_02825 [Acidiferrobacter sp. SPIII_3]AWP22874.1 hypothetical protein C4901_05550 [Acidiferrobacter sp. SPIII_3]AWP23223.1 hypothetical protein C4901_07680 [Acidiferrobacter sp. SPIII_3]AWP23314.1 hypothetical protein C4901_08175 [Acidiferrobacter sp. SPIII_3]
MLAGRLLDTFALDEEALADMREVEVIVERVRAPDAAGFDATVGQGRRLGVVGCPALLEIQRDGGLKRRLVALDREVVVCSLPDDVFSQCALRQQRIGGDVPAGEFASRKQRDGHADFVGLLVFVGPGYRQGTDFFWA